MKVHLRQRKQTKKGGRISLYLEIYKGTTQTADGKIKGAREYEYLNLYLIDKPRNPVDKQNNKDNLKLAESIKAKRELEIKNGQYGFNSEFKTNTNFVEYFQLQAEKRKANAGNYGNWDSAIKHFVRFVGGTKITFKEIDKKFCEEFKEYLVNEARARTKDGKKRNGNKKLSTSCTHSYFAKFKACLNKAVEEDIILRSPARNISPPTVIESQREYLTLDELKKLVKTECKYPDLKNAFIFCCLTGLRWSDIKKLKWSEVQKNNDDWRITFHQQKTKGLQYLDISEQAREYLGEQGKPDEIVLPGLRYTSYHNFELHRWILKAGITKNITFHSSRHTFAVMQLNLGTEIYTVSKLLGHSNLKTTQIYSKIVDEKKREAVNKIPDLTI